MTASNYSANAFLNALLRAVALTLPTDVFVSLHTADPGATGASELTTGTWPAYVRQSSKGGGAIGAAWSEAGNPTHKIALNANVMLFPAYDGAGTITITHFGLWTASTGGNCLYTGKLVVDPTDVGSTAAPRILGVTDELVIKANQLGVKVT